MGVKILGVNELFFELSNEDRLALIRMLREEPSNLTALSKKHDLSLQQTSRHLNRLGKNGLTEKTPSGKYVLTGYGWLIVDALDHLSFVSTHRDYICGHDLHGLPLDFLRTIDRLGNSDLKLNAIEFLGYISQNLEKATNFIYLQIDLYPFETAENLIAAPEKGVRVRVLKNHAVSRHDIAFNPVHLRSHDRASPFVEVRRRVIDGPYLYVSDAGCAVAFKTGSEFDYKGFTSQDPDAIEWCKGVFEYNWETIPPPPTGQKSHQVTTCRYRAGAPRRRKYSHSQVT